MTFFDYQGPEAPPSIDERLEIEVIRERILRKDSFRDAYELLNAQLNAIHLRATAIFTICGVVVTVTGFSGRLIAGTSPLGQVFVIAGLLLCVLAAAIAMLFVTPVRWMTSYMYMEPDEWLLTAIRRRNRKTRAFRAATIILVLGLTLYGLAICLMLYSPDAGQPLPVR